jgi:AraC-like DNA-binding protein
MVEIFQNIRKIYNFSNPCEELSAFVEFFSVSSLIEPTHDLNGNYSAVKMFPSWTPTFYINLGTSYYIDLKRTRYLIKENQDILILRNDDVIRHKLPTDNIFTVKFYPGGLEAVLGINQAALVDQVIDLNDILPIQLLAKIKQPLSFEERVELMQSFLLASYTKSDKKDHYLNIVNSSIGEYHASGMKLNTTDVAERLFITSKTINRYFNRVVGISPKSYFSILRARTALTEFVNHKDKFVLMDYGYYDLSHFHKDMVKFTGQKLTESIT